MVEDLQLNDIRKLTDRVMEKYGYDFKDYALASFKRRIIFILNEQELRSIDDLLERILNSEKAFNQFLSDLTVNTTEMFRDPEFWSYLSKEVIPKLKNSKIKIWHAGCSSGEEVYSMAILLKELDMLDKVTITATDISNSILDKAKKGSYTLSKMETNRKNYEKFGGTGKLEDYYSLNGRIASMNQDLLKNVLFVEHNLASDGNVLGKFDIIMCRNVMIYFNSNLQDKVYRLFHKSMSSGGHLAIGIRESMVWSSIANKYLCLNQKEKVFKKIEE